MTSELHATVFKELLQKIRVDNRKLGRLFTPLFYTKQANIAFFEYKNLKQANDFDILDYFTIITSEFEEYGEEIDPEERNKAKFEQAKATNDLTTVEKMLKEKTLGIHANGTQKFFEKSDSDSTLVEREEPYITEQTKFHHFEIVSLLIQYGADINIPDDKGKTAQDWAKEFGIENKYLIAVVKGLTARVAMLKKEPLTPSEKSK